MRSLLVILMLTMLVAYLCTVLASHSYSLENMQLAYYHGCNIGLNQPISEESKARCRELSNTFANTLDHISN